MVFKIIMMSKVNISAICTVGLPGSGKGIFIRAAESIGLPYYIMGDVVREEAYRKYGESSSSITRRCMVEIREKKGKDVVAKLIYKRILSDGVEGYILIDGLRSMDELNFFKRVFRQVFVIGVLSDLSIRFKRLMDRGRVDDVKGLREFIERDMGEIRIGIRDVLFNADIFFLNMDLNEEEAVSKAINLLRMIIRGDLGGKEEE